MKKFMVGLVVITLAFSMASCSNSNGNNTDNNKETGNAQGEETVVDSASETAFSNGEQYFNEGKYDSAIKSYEQVAEGSPNYETAQERIRQANEKYKNKILDDITEYTQKSEYKNAISVLEEAIEKMPDDPDLKSKLEEITKARCDYILEEANQMVLNDDYIGAIDFITKKEQCADIYPEVAEKLEEYISAYVKKEIEFADGMVEDGDYDGAIEELGKALTTLPSNEEITKKKKELEDSKPVPLSDIKITNYNEGRLKEITDNSAEDSLGNLYSPTNLYQINTFANSNWGIEAFNDNEYHGYMEINLDKKYKSVIGTISVSDLTPSAEMQARLEIYIDDKLVDTINLNRKTDPIEIKYDISSKKWLTLKLMREQDREYGEFYVLLSDFNFYK